MPRISPARAFSNTGQASEVDLALGKHGVTPAMSQRVVTEQTIGAAVAASMRGDLTLGEISPEEWIARERVAGESLAELGLSMFDQGEVVKAAEMGVGIYDRFIPSGLDRKQLLRACEQAGIKLYAGNAKDGDYDGERIATVAGIFTLDYASIFRPTNADQHPYMLPYDRQWSWAAEQGGDGFSTAEEAMYMAFLRPKAEIGYLPYMGGSIRCQNDYGSDDSLYVRWNADYGLDVNGWSGSDANWNLWALPRKFRALGVNPPWGGLVL
jgi:hypothetical protein